MDGVRVNDGDDISDRNYTSQLGMVGQMVTEWKLDYLSNSTSVTVMSLIHTELICCVSNPETKNFRCLVRRNEEVTQNYQL